MSQAFPQSKLHFGLLRRGLAMLAMWFALSSNSVFAATPAEEFDTANKLYEEGNFVTAISAYLHLTSGGRTAPVVYFNLGNAYFKTGQNGRALQSYLRAARLAPRDREIRANLQFVRDSLGTGESAAENPWQRLVSWLTPGELTLAATIGYWLCFGFLGIGQLRPIWQPRLRLPSWIAGIVCVVALGWLAAASRGELSTRHGIIVAPEAVVRLGPLEASQSSHSLRDGAEVTILETRQDWLRVQDAQKRVGWLRSTQVATL